MLLVPCEGSLKFHCWLPAQDGRLVTRLWWHSTELVPHMLPRRGFGSRQVNLLFLFNSVIFYSVLASYERHGVLLLGLRRHEPRCSPGGCVGPYWHFAFTLTSSYGLCLTFNICCKRAQSGSFLFTAYGVL